MMPKLESLESKEKRTKYKFFIHSGLQCNRHEVNNFTYITFFTFTTTTKWRVDFRRKGKEKEKGNVNVGFSFILVRTIFH